MKYVRAKCKSPERGAASGLQSNAGATVERESGRPAWTARRRTAGPTTTPRKDRREHCRGLYLMRDGLSTCGRPQPGRRGREPGAGRRPTVGNVKVLDVDEPELPYLR